MNERADKKTPLYELHLGLGARVISFHGYVMPLYYDSIVSEHLCVRNGAGLFDVSHMGKLEVSGDGSFSLVQYVTTNDTGKLTDKQVQYTPMCNEGGGIVDDVLVYKWDERKFTVVGNCSRRERDLLWLQRHSAGHQPARIKDVTESMCILALQGPLSSMMIENAFDSNFSFLKRFRFIDYSWRGVPVTISRTGYTGEDGYEVFMDARYAADMWNLLLNKNKEHGIKPCGLGARDTLRLEACFMLYGNDIDETITPLETPIGWTVKFDKGDFIGREALWKQKTGGIKRRLAGFEMIEQGIPRHGYPAMKDDEYIGTVTSGTFSPLRKKGIGLCLMKPECAQAGQEFHIQIRNASFRARVVDIPFYKRGEG